MPKHLLTRQHLRTEGIVLHLIQYGDYDQIATVFTPETGVIKLIIKGGMSHKRNRGAPLSPLTRAEFVYTLGRGELHISREVTPLERYHHNNRSFAHLEAACAMAQALRQSQLLEKPAPMLYELFLVFLQGLETCELPRTWTCSFLLKILRHEGLVSDFDSCSQCETPLSNLWVGHGEVFCKTHSPPQALTMNEQETTLIRRLLETRSLAELTAIDISEALHGKINTLFSRALKM